MIVLSLKMNFQINIMGVVTFLLIELVLSWIMRDMIHYEKLKL